MTPGEYRSALRRGASPTTCASSPRREFALPLELFEPTCAAQLAHCSSATATLFDERARAGRIVEGHGDLRPEHVCLEREPQIIDCLEFSRDFRIARRRRRARLPRARMRAPRRRRARARDLRRVRRAAAAMRRPTRSCTSTRATARACARRSRIRHLDEPALRDPRDWRGAGARLPAARARARRAAAPRPGAATERLRRRAARRSSRRRAAARIASAKSRADAQLHELRLEAGVGDAQRRRSCRSRRFARRGSPPSIALAVAGEDAVRGGGDRRAWRPRLRQACAARAIVVPRADQVVDDDRDLAVDVADERLAAHHAAAAVLLRERRADRPAERRAPGAAGTPRRA